ncbi:arylsulfatase [Rhodococcus sp. H29-C3]|uniref:arylsulfatase n=1 Tax=Rhodococcus sp. H29-C3 TaxID=3046307 RepID=UPI0024BA5B94|nr:arylsulfatase [Rhodococcus sp. H29-C3]MDJ0359289.1 arylsulfatase [Rhodococcus sp. H29-C3]
MNRYSIPIQQQPSKVSAAYDYRTQNPQFSRPEKIRPPAGAPNVLLVMVDDVGFGAASAFGGPCRTPTAERLADGGIKYSRFHTTALCSPTRSATLTGRNHHSVGFGVIAEQAGTSPGYNGTRPDSAATVARVLQGNGYATGAFGKMHQTPPWEITPAGPFDRWPLREGFEKFYGFLGAESDQFEPVLVDGFTVVDPPKTPEEGYHMTEDLVDQTLNWVEGVKTMDPDKPWFAYVPFGACHAPLQIPDSYLDKYRGEFDHGWDRQRELTLEKQIELGVVGPDTVLAPWAPGLPHWDELDEDQKKVSARLMEIYAAFLEHTDDEVGRLVDTLESRGELENTLIIYMLGDNGASAEGGMEGSFNYLAGLNGFKSTTAEVLARLDELGQPSSYPHYPASWAMALDTPYQWAKQVASHYGGTRNGLIMHWPRGIAETGQVRHQWHHCIDITPTILEAAGIPAPHMVDGTPQTPMEGVAMNYTFTDPDAEDRHTTQYFEIFGNRGIYDHGWTAVTAHRPPWLMATRGVKLPTMDEDRWELYDTTQDWSQAADLAEVYPEKLAELKQKFVMEASKFQVFPLDDRTVSRFPTEESRPPHPMRGRTRMKLYPHMDGLNEKAAPNFFNRSFSMTARIDSDCSAASGVLASIGGRFGGLSFYMLEGKPVYCYNYSGGGVTHVRAEQTIAADAKVLAVDFDYDGKGFGMGGDVTISVDGAVVAQGRVEATARGIFSMNEQFDIGRNRGSAVSPDYQRKGAFAFTGTLTYLEVDLPAAEDISAAERARIEMATH